MIGKLSGNAYSGSDPSRYKNAGFKQCTPSLFRPSINLMEASIRILQLIRLGAQAEIDCLSRALAPDAARPNIEEVNGYSLT